MLINDAINFHRMYRPPNSEFNGKIERKPHDFDTKDTKDTKKKDDNIKLSKKGTDDNSKEGGGCCG